MGLFTKLFGTRSDREIKHIQPTVDKILRLEEEYKALSEEEIDDLDDEKKNEQLAIYWCAKEAIFKRMSQNRVDFAEQIEVEKFNVRKEGELEATFIHKDEHEEEFELEYMMFDRHVLVWLVG